MHVCVFLCLCACASKSNFDTVSSGIQLGAGRGAGAAEDYEPRGQGEVLAEAEASAREASVSDKDDPHVISTAEERSWLLSAWSGCESGSLSAGRVGWANHYGQPSGMMQCRRGGGVSRAPPTPQSPFPQNKKVPSPQSTLAAVGKDPTPRGGGNSPVKPHWQGVGRVLPRVKPQSVSCILQRVIPWVAECVLSCAKNCEGHLCAHSF